ncbi:MAG: glycosyl transferase [Clostridia bacterium]|nr:glycosyl transferase [Clostridia bacterium]
MGKHAFLILAHKNDENFRTLISLLDNERNDIFIHMDKKNKNYQKKEIEGFAKHSKIYHVKRLNVTWGSFAMVKAELELLKKSTKTGIYDYYHLLSGDDLPIKPISYIHRFFDANVGFEFVGMVQATEKYRFRINRFYFFQNKIGRNKAAAPKLIKKFDRYVELITKKTKAERNKSLKLWYGSQWFSITDNFARYVVKSKKWIYRHFNYSYIPDELFLQTLLAKSAFMKNAYKTENNSSYKSAMRYIDWSRGRPYVFRSEDMDELMATDMLFARKFDSTANPGLTNKISEKLKNEGIKQA